MAIYAIGDVQGCFNELLLLLDKIKFNRRIDRLWFTGDLVNRGPNSLETLRFIKSLGESATVVLGNHDLHLLACYYGIGKLHKRDTLNAILSAVDCYEILDWLRKRPLLHYEENYCLVHAGLPPQWDLSLARKCAYKVEKILRDTDKIIEFFSRMYGDFPTQWKEELDEWSMIRFIVNAFTRMRYCSKDGSIDVHHKGSPGSQPTELVPWFEHPDRQSGRVNIIFGHWSTLGITEKKGVYSLDTGCLWGGKLTALRLDGDYEKYFQIECECAKTFQGS
ncbi:MAG: symmetrical bis(5'-nucleosyl)-tetraphosphatase [Methylococcales bacterium]